MSKVEIYTKPLCPYCSRALRLLHQKGIEVEEIPAWMQAEQRQRMIQRTGGKTTYPQIFINGQHIGGCDDMMALEQAGKLDALLQA